MIPLYSRYHSQLLYGTVPKFRGSTSSPPFPGGVFGGKLSNTLLYLQQVQQSRLSVSYMPRVQYISQQNLLVFPSATSRSHNNIMTYYDHPHIVIIIFISTIITFVMDSNRCHCVCRRASFPSRKALARHKQSCPVLNQMIEMDIHILQSSTHYNSRHRRDEDDIVYDMDNYDAASIFDDIEHWNQDEIEVNSYGDTSDLDDHSATWSDVVDDEYSVTIMDIDGYDSNDSFIPSSHSTHWSSSSSLSSSSSSSSLSSSSAQTLPHYCPPMIANKPRHNSAIFKLQSQLNNLFDNNKASIAMLQPRQQFVSSCEKAFGIESMKPEYAQVRMTNDSLVTVPVFDVRAMILSFRREDYYGREVHNRYNSGRCC